MKSYLANGLFSFGDRLVNTFVSSRMKILIPGLKLYVPQENESINDKKKFANSLQIAQADKTELMKSDFLIAVIDGVEIDSGVAAEIGLFSSTGKPIYALFTDNRQEGTSNMQKIDALAEDPLENQFIYRNLFVVGLIKRSGGGIFNEIDDIAKAVTDRFGKGKKK